jgi:RNA polymerase sigma-70 factor (ECF subfamily)
MVADSKHDSCTDQSLILFMANGTSASDAWGVFIDKYGRRLYEWSRQWCANHHDAEELVQETILIVFRKIGVFQRKSEGCFRSWLREISYRCWLDMLKRRKRFERPIYDHQVLDHQRSQIEHQTARAELEKLFDNIADQEILELALTRARVKVREKTWNAFVMVDMKSERVEDVAVALGISRGAVHMAVYTVRKFIREESQKLDTPQES